MDEQPEVPPSKQPKRFFDIASPKDFRPSPTSRPLIVGHHPEQADPMVTAAADKPEPTAVAIHIAPEPDVSAPTPTPVEPPVVEPEPQTPEETHRAQPEPVAQTAETMMQQEYDEIEHELPSGETMAPAASQPIAVGQPVVVHHNHHPHPIAKKLLTVLIVVVVLVVVSDVLLDANIWKPTHQFPHTHFLHK